MNCVPIRFADWDRLQNGSVLLIRPKFESRLMNRLIHKLGISPVYRITLDAYGSAVWECCDGQKTALEISEHLKAQFSEIEESVYQRVALFLSILLHQRCITLKDVH
jgi:hypothetical protein